MSENILTHRRQFYSSNVHVDHNTDKSSNSSSPPRSPTPALLPCVSSINFSRESLHSSRASSINDSLPLAQNAHPDITCLKASALDLLFSTHILHQWFKTCLRTIFNCFWRNEISLGFALRITIPLASACLASPPPSCTESSRHESLAQQLNRASSVAQRAFRILQSESEPDLEAPPPPATHTSFDSRISLSLFSSNLPIYPDATIGPQFPAPTFKLFKSQREIWAKILRSIVINESLRRDEPMIYQFENPKRRNIFLICLAACQQCRSLRKNLELVKIRLSETIEPNKLWNSKALSIDEDVLAWVTEAQSIPSGASRTLITLQDQSWAWLAIYRPKPNMKSKRSFDEISK